jgi:chemotaxis protein CheD
MASGTAVMSVPQTSVGMGQIAVARKPGRLGAVLGSCVGVALYHARLGLGAMAHVVLPDSCGRAGSAAKFADTAVPELVRQLQRQGANPSVLSAKIVGGACMFGSGGPLQIGQANIEAVLGALDRAGIRVTARHTGGTTGRRVTLDCSDGTLTVETAGNPPRVL